MEDLPHQNRWNRFSVNRLKRAEEKPVQPVFFILRITPLIRFSVYRIYHPVPISVKYTVFDSRASLRGFLARAYPNLDVVGIVRSVLFTVVARARAWLCRYNLRRVTPQKTGIFHSLGDLAQRFVPGLPFKVFSSAVCPPAGSLLGGSCYLLYTKLWGPFGHKKRVLECWTKYTCSSYLQQQGYFWYNNNISVLLMEHGIAPVPMLLFPTDQRIACWL